MNRYRTSPLAESTTPKGIPYIIGNEAAERFSFYGMRAILVVFMTQSLVHANGQADYCSRIYLCRQKLQRKNLYTKRGSCRRKHILLRHMKRMPCIQDCL